MEIKKQLNEAVKALLGTSEQADNLGIVHQYTLNSWADACCYWVRSRQSYLSNSHSNSKNFRSVNELQVELRALIEARTDQDAPHGGEEVAEIAAEIQRVKDQLDDLEQLQVIFDVIFESLHGRKYVMRAARKRGGPALPADVQDSIIAEALAS